MARATNLNGLLQPISDCYIRVGRDVIVMKVLPSINDSHGATFNSENGIGRSLPTKTFVNGGDRSIGWDITFVSEGDAQLRQNLSYYRLLMSCTYPVDTGGNVPFLPPKILKIKCGSLLADEEICVILENISVSWPTDSAWSDIQYGYIPYKFNCQLTFKVVYNSADLPGQQRILTLGR
jgi:hypothetical protein